MHTQTADLKTAGREASAQTDIAYYDGRFISKSKVKSLSLEDKEEQRRETSRLKQEREESIQRLIHIEKQLQNSQIRPIWDQDESSQTDEDDSDYRYNRKIYKNKDMPPKRKKRGFKYSEGDRRSRPENQGDCCKCN